MSITIRDVAQKAGVSVATVSKIINNKPSISEATKQRVLQIMTELDYHPNSQASNFARQCSYNVVFVAVTEMNCAFHNPHMFEILSGAQKKIHGSRYNFSFLGVSSVEEAYEKTKDIIGRKTADGILIHGSATSKPLVNLMESSNFPHIFIGRPPFVNTACWIDTNNRISGQMATKFLTSCGYEHIAFIGGPEKDEISQHRLEGFISTMQNRGVIVPASYIKYGTYSKKSGYELMQELLRSANPPEAVICEGNLIAMGAASAIRKHGMSIPDHIGLITFDDYPLSQLIEPPLTVVDINVHEMGEQAADILLNKIKNPDFQIQSFATLPTLIIRESTKTQLQK